MEDTVNRDFSTFHALTLSLSSLILFLLLFSSLTLSASGFSPAHIVGSLTSKLPSIQKAKVGGTSPHYQLIIWHLICVHQDLQCMSPCDRLLLVK